MKSIIDKVQEQLMNFCETGDNAYFSLKRPLLNRKSVLEELDRLGASYQIVHAEFICWENPRIRKWRELGEKFSQWDFEEDLESLFLKEKGYDFETEIDGWGYKRQKWNQFPEDPYNDLRLLLTISIAPEIFGFGKIKEPNSEETNFLEKPIKTSNIYLMDLHPKHNSEKINTYKRQAKLYFPSGINRKPSNPKKAHEILNKFLEESMEGLEIPFNFRDIHEQLYEN